MKRTLRILSLWIILSLIFQIGLAALLNHKIQDMMGWTENNKLTDTATATNHLTATIQTSAIENVQISYDNSYLAYLEKSTLKIFNLKKGTVVFEKTSPSADKTIGVVNYQWLPDRNSLIYFYNNTVSKTSTVKVSRQTKKSYTNTPVLEFYSVSLPDSDEDSTPSEQLNEFDSDSEKIPTGIKINEIANSPATGTTYFTAGDKLNWKLYKISIMKEISSIQNAGNVSEMAVSDCYDTVYAAGKIGSKHQIIAINNNSHVIIAQNPDCTVLGVKNGKVYLGEILNNTLTKILTTDDLKTLTANPFLQTVWAGSIPLNKGVKKVITPDGKIIIYSDQTANVITDGKLTKINLKGNENYISEDGTKVIQLTEQDNSTSVDIKPLQ